MSLYRFLPVFLILSIFSFKSVYAVDNLFENESYISCPEMNADKATIVDFGGILWCVWEGSSSVNKKENSLWMSRYIDERWTKPLEFVTGDFCNPNLCRITLKEILLFYTDNKDMSKVYCLRTINGGKTWLSPRLLPAGIIGPQRGTPFFDKKTGTLLIPTSNSSGKSEDVDKNTSCWIEVCDSGVKKWYNRYGPIISETSVFGPSEPSIILNSRGKFKMFCRNRSRSYLENDAFILYAESADKGRTWGAFENLIFPNPDSGIYALQMNSLVVVIGNYSFDKKKNMACLISQDYADNWSRPILIDADESENPAAVFEGEEYLHIVYTVRADGYKRIKYKKAKITNLLFSPMNGLEEEMKKVLPVRY